LRSPVIDRRLRHLRCREPRREVGRRRRQILACHGAIGRTRRRACRAWSRESRRRRRWRRGWRVRWRGAGARVPGMGARGEHGRCRDGGDTQSYAAKRNNQRSVHHGLPDACVDHRM
jgi:hypothetical protein